jgi:hypothetical protein
MLTFPNRILMALPLCGALAMPALAQTVDVKGPTAGETAKTERGVTASGEHRTAGATASLDRGQESATAPGQATRIVPKPTPGGGAGKMAPLNGDESGVAPRANVQNAQGPEAQAARSAESTARKTIYDPENQLGTSLRGTTQPVPGAPVPDADGDTAKDTASNGPSPAAGGQ